MKRPRPHIPLSVRVAVAERMAYLRAIEANRLTYWELYCSRLVLVSHENPWPLKDRLESLLYHLFGDEKAHLDHDPALILREFNQRNCKYTPDANNPHYLIYRTVAEHLQKTIGRTVGASKTVTTKGSDIFLKAKFARLEKPPKFKKRIPSRPFPKSNRRIQNAKRAD